MPPKLLANRDPSSEVPARTSSVQPKSPWAAASQSIRGSRSTTRAETSS